MLAEAERHLSSGVPSQDVSETPLDHGPSGRIERRLPIIVVVRLAPGLGPASNGGERTFTDNISPSGARIFSKHPWQPGDLVWVTPQNAEVAPAKVIYCQRLPDARYTIGVAFQDHPVSWSAMQRFNNL